MGLRTDQHRVADHDRVLSPATQDGVLHHEDIAPDDHRTVNGVDHRQVENSRPRADSDLSGQDRMRLDPGVWMQVYHAH
jgi:hypothetical protein